MKNMKKKILIILDDLFISGVLTLNQHLFSTLAGQKDYEFFLLCGLFPNQQHLLKEFSFCKKIYTYPISTPRNQLENFIFIAFNTRKLIKKILKQQQFDYVIFNLPYSSFGAICSGKIKKEICLNLFHGAVFLEKESLSWQGKLNVLQRIKLSLILLFYKFLQRIVLSYGKIICFSSYAKNLVKKSFNIKKNIYVLPIPYLKKDIGIDKKKFKINLGFSQYTKIFLFPSRIEPRKGLHLLVKAAQYLSKEKENIVILVVGPIVEKASGYFVDMVKNSIYYSYNNTRLYFSPELPPYLLKKYYYAADATIMASVNLETFGMVTLESLSLGTPVIGIPTGATKEIISKFDKRLLAKKVDAYYLFKVIKWYSELPENQRKEIRKQGIKFVRKYFDPKKTERVFKEILNRKLS